MEATLNDITAAITIPKVDFNLLKELANRFGWIIQTEKKSGIEEAIDDVKAGRVYHAKDAHDLIKQCLAWNILLTIPIVSKNPWRRVLNEDRILIFYQIG